MKGRPGLRSCRHRPDNSVWGTSAPWKGDMQRIAETVKLEGSSGCWRILPRDLRSQREKRITRTVPQSTQKAEGTKRAVRSRL